MRIAIVEDERSLAQILKKGFKDDGHDVELYHDASSVRSGLIQSKAQFDLIILDIMLPDEDGADVCRALRAAGILTPILVLTARDSTEDRIKMLDIGADDFMSKPFSFDELRARARVLGRRVPVPTGTEMVAGDVRIDASARMAYRAGDQLPLTSRELDLLAYLMLNAGRPIGRGELLKNVWGQDTGAFTNVVDVHVHNLRKKLDDNHDEKHINTVHGSGYLFTA